MHARLPHDSSREAECIDALIASCAEAALEATATQMEGPQPIFVVGMPRSGTTVLERILGSHSQVTSAGELGDFARALSWATDHAMPVLPDAATIARLPSVDWNELGCMYLQQTQWRARGKRYFVDKLPRNWMLAGLIHRALPKASILHLVRNDMDVLFSNWRAYFGPGPEYAYSYDQASLAAHYANYRRLMAHWHAACPGAILDIEYSRLVHAPETVVKEVLTFCGLDFEHGVLDRTRNDTPVATLSVSQVREPIHTSSFGVWRSYAAQLQKLEMLLRASNVANDSAIGPEHATPAIPHA
jgi:hypothetical protein